MRPQSSFSQFFSESSTVPVPQSFPRTANNSFNTAKRIGILRASSSSTKVKFKGKLNAQDPVDFFRLDIAPGATFSTQIDSGKLQGGKVRVINYVAFSGQTPFKAQTQVYNPGSFSKEYNDRFANNTGSPIQIYYEVRSLSKTKSISYNATSLFT